MRNTALGLLSLGLAATPCTGRVCEQWTRTTVGRTARAVEVLADGSMVLAAETSHLGRGGSNTVWAGFALPIDLGLLGAPGCLVHCSPDAILGPIALSPAGTASTVVALPAACGLIGAHLYSQFVLLDTPVNALGITTSNGVDMRIGS